MLLEFHACVADCVSPERSVQASLAFIGLDGQLCRPSEGAADFVLLEVYDGDVLVHKEANSMVAVVAGAAPVIIMVVGSNAVSFVMPSFEHDQNVDAENAGGFCKLSGLLIFSAVDEGAQVPTCDFEFMGPLFHGVAFVVSKVCKGLETTRETA